MANSIKALARNAKEGSMGTVSNFGSCSLALCGSVVVVTMVTMAGNLSQYFQHKDFHTGGKNQMKWIGCTDLLYPKVIAH